MAERVAPIEPAPSRWLLPPASSAGPEEIVGIGADLLPGSLLMAYRHGLFPMPINKGGDIGWFSPNPRGVIWPQDFHTSRSLLRSAKRFETSMNQDFGAVIRTCAEIDRPGSWINDDIIDAYTELHRLGWAHSVEVWSDDQLVGGVYGVCVGGLFAGESMFHLATDASKVALLTLMTLLDDGHARLLDVQWLTDHLSTLGAVEVDRDDYVALLPELVSQPIPASFLVR